MLSLSVPSARLAGFTLVEVLVVLVILSIVTGTTVLSLKGIHHREGERAVRQLARSMQAAAEYAEVRGIPIRLELQPGGYQFSVLEPRGVWVVLQQPRILAPSAWYAEMGVRALVVSGRKQTMPDRLLFPSGEAPVFELYLNTVNGLRVIRGNGSGTIEVEGGDDAA